MNYNIKNINLASEGIKHIEWAAKQMPVLELIKKRFIKEKPLRGIRLGCCLHVTSETAALMIALKAGGAEPVLCASNPLSTQDDVAAALVKYYYIPVFAIKDEDSKTYYRHIHSVLETRPQVSIDDGADLVTTLHNNQAHSHLYYDIITQIRGGTEETTTGVTRLRAMEKACILKYPIIAVNDAKTKYLFDNRYGTGQSTIDGLLRATNILLAGKNFVICGYGWCGRGLALRAKGMGAKVIICEVEPLKALEATMDGFEVMPIVQAAKIGDIFVTVSGNISVLSKEHFLKMHDGAILANAGHFNVEINIAQLKAISKRVKHMKSFVDEYTLKNGRKLYLLAEGRLINLAAAEGHPAAVMDMSFANQALCVEYIVKKSRAKNQKLENRVYPVPKQIDEEIAQLKLMSMGIKIDTLTKRQKEYLLSWQQGT